MSSVQFCSVVTGIICFVAVASEIKRRWREKIYAGMRNYNYHLLKTGQSNAIMQLVNASDMDLAINFVKNIKILQTGKTLRREGC